MQRFSVTLRQLELTDFRYGLTVNYRVDRQQDGQQEQFGDHDDGRSLIF